MTARIPHNGGPCPVDPETTVEVEFRNGDRLGSYCADYWTWPHDDSAYDILALVQPQWRPIESAPRDGTPVMAAVEVFDSTTRQSLGWDMHIIFADDETGQIHNDCEAGWRFDDYTHWLPLPATPEVK
jgi:hypothetical protein